MKIKLIEAAIAKAKLEARLTGRRIELSDSLAMGLRLRVSTKGHPVWVLAIKDKRGDARRFKLGEFPQIGIAAAREAARVMRADVLAGRDPVEEARQQRAMRRDAKAGIGTLRALLDEYAVGPGKELRSGKECYGRVSHVFSIHLDEPLQALTRAGLWATATKHARKAPHSASAAVRYLRPILKWASKRGLVASECPAIETPAKPSRRRERALSEDELRPLLRALREIDSPYARAMRFMLLTVARREEVCSAIWRDVDVQTKVWTIPQAKAKNGREHRVPLSTQALELLGKPGRPGALLFPSSEGGRLSNWDRETKRVLLKLGLAERDLGTKKIRLRRDTQRWHRHDLRRTGATMLGEMGEMPHVIEAALNHVSIHSPIAAVYNQARYRPQVAAALQRLADRLDAIETGPGKLAA
jgi:integrase